jgi:hypothetical protein
LRDVKTVMRELPVDILEFFYLTPLPGSEDHKVLAQKGEWMDPDLNKYDLNHVCANHALMSKAEWERAYVQAWRTFYDKKHVRTVLRRAAATRNSVGKTLFLLGWFMGSIHIERIHPLECGLIRRKVRRDRRPGMALEPAVLFYPKYWLEVVVKQLRWLALYGQFTADYHLIKRDAKRAEYMDEALNPVFDDEEDERAMFQTDEAKTYVAQQRRMAEFRVKATA